MGEPLRATRAMAVAGPAIGVAEPWVDVRQLPAASRFALRIREADAVAAEVAAGFRLDQAINRFAADGGHLSARLGPDEWLLVGPEAEADAMEREVAAALGGRFHALVDIGHRNAAFAVSGRLAAETINSGCPLDLGRDAFPTGTATRTRLGHAEIVLMRIDDAPTYRVECWRSFAAYVGAFLVEAAAGVEPVA